MNSIIRWTCERSRNIGLTLLSARCVMRKALGLGARGDASGWNAVKPVALALLDKVTPCFGKGLLDVLLAPSRWDSAPPAESCPTTKEIDRTMLKLEPVAAVEFKTWALKYNSQIHSAFPKATVERGFSVKPGGKRTGELNHGDKFYIV